MTSLIASVLVEFANVLFKNGLSDLKAYIAKIEARQAVQAANATAVKDGIANGDTTEIENQLGNSTAGQPSGIPGIEQRPSLPGVTGVPKSN
jgi:hypothetical protein